MPQPTLEKRQNLANLALVAAVGGLIAQQPLVNAFPGYAGAMPHIKMAFEAALVGGLADWFAVTAIFRKPFNLPIPHTAIITENKDRIADTIGLFVQQNFLTSAAIRQSFTQNNVAGQMASPTAHERG